jgi:hypothetical protein
MRNLYPEEPTPTFEQEPTPTFEQQQQQQQQQQRNEENADVPADEGQFGRGDGDGVMAASWNDDDFQVII